MINKAEFKVWGIDGSLIGNESRLMICLPIFRINKEAKLGVASILPWSLGASETIRWLPNETKAQEIGTQLNFSTLMDISPGEVLLIAGPRFLEGIQKANKNDLKKTVTDFKDFQNGFKAKIIALNESVELCSTIGSLARKYFDIELKREKCQKVTDNAKVFLRTLQETPKVLVDEKVRRKLLVFEIEHKYDEYLRSLKLNAIRLKTTETNLKNDLLQYKELLLRQFDESLPEKLNYAIELYEVNHNNNFNNKGSEQSTIHFITSDYTGIFHLSDFQNKLLKELKQSYKLTLQREDAKNFHSIGKIQRLNKKYIYAFPMYLTADKIRDGFYTIPYGKLNKIGAIVPKCTHGDIISDFISPNNDQTETVELSKLIIEAINNKSKILCPSYYAMQEIVEQCSLEKELENSDYIAKSYEPREGFNLIPTIEEESIFLFDLGDLEQIQNDIKLATDNVKQNSSYKMKHLPGYTNNLIANATVFKNIIVDVYIPVGIGFSSYLVKWLAEGKRWKTLQEWALNELKMFELNNDFKQIGISLLDDSNSVHSTNKIPEVVIKED